MTYPDHVFAVYKYQVELTDWPTIQMPWGAVILAAREVDGKLWLWAQVDTRHRETTRYLRVAGTGHELGLAGKHIDTVVTESGLVWHVFDIKEGRS